ncbi:MULTISPECIES: branched-chain amino acid ABC transporter permease [unclassified Brenneria]|uniref:branched-chain amino acid ABC transporter permease n=1 Tax=unclassified Brenneria TaxID=2634434 RepID=UPI001555E9F5|nr:MULTISPECIES: branched-chain amino acid ABC transporter permease [unclassified Brenneria]MBJ7221264.1 branched-chain amino acid ABC transporter permease [Brenneria sp. L3-3C-1]MEE3642508.1 branched-chain amino acid ABC transporter permease [Brenneria sp. L3_3C_1]MEE3650120.1 branched-chain amino acid ABC transporter permease [Brenneria sp. HEZEL_4_2_4]NPD00079.1 branched-chain amino acid ABC transporter permease [Brenneria sp. hezel4-2-4]
MKKFGDFALTLAVVIPALLATFWLAEVLELYALLSVTVFLVMALLSLSLAFIWGYGGILCFGQAAFFGLGAYTYAVCAINWGDSTWAVAAAIALPTLFSMLLGYVIFYGGVSDVYLGAITLAVSLVLFNWMNSTSGSEYHIGEALLGGFNGMPSVPTLNVPFTPDEILSPEALFMVTAGCLILCYALLKLVLASRFGKTLVAIRENEQRAGLLGYNVPAHKLWAFAIGGAIAGAAGCLYVNWGAFVSPGVFSISQSAQIIIWVIVGGRGTLMGPVISCIALQWLVTRLGAQQTIDTNLVLGIILTLFVLLLPGGLLPTLMRLFKRRRSSEARKVTTDVREVRQ